MIVDQPQNGGSKVAPTVPGEGSLTDPQNPPPYSPSSEFSNTGDQKALPNPPSGSVGELGRTPPADLPPPCNHLLHHRSDDSIKGVWHVDTAMTIPEGLLAGVEEFDGEWNGTDPKALKERKKLGAKGKRRSEDSSVPGTTSEVRPNLMLQCDDGSINADVHVVSSDGELRQALIVVEAHDGSVTLEVRNYAAQPLRIFATSRDGSVRVRIPQTFEGAVVAQSKDGSLKFSDPIKARMTTFFATDVTRGYIGDWKSAGFGANPSADSSLPAPADPFSTWTGPLVHVRSNDGNVYLSYCDEEVKASGGESNFVGTFKGFITSLFGGETSQRTAGTGAT